MVQKSAAKVLKKKDMKEKTDGEKERPRKRDRGIHLGFLFALANRDAVFVQYFQWQDRHGNALICPNENIQTMAFLPEG